MKKTNKKINLKYNYYKNYKDIKEIIEKRYNILIVLITVLVFVLFIKIFYVQIVNKNEYKIKLDKLTQNTIEGSTAPRGRIYDRNNKLIVDNEPCRIIYYQKQDNITSKEEIQIAYYLAENIKIDNKNNEKILKTFWIKTHEEETNKKITKQELQKLKMRKITDDDIENYKYDRITKEELDKFSKKDEQAAYIYYLMNKGYLYSEKIIKDENVTDEEYALVASNIYKLKGVNIKLDWNRVYPYEDTLKTIIGSVSTSKSGIPSDLKKYYLDKGYNLNDRVGTSYLEYQYDDYLKGKKNKYEIGENGEKILKESGHRGNDLYLTIDIELQQQIEKIIEKELIKTKSEPNTKYFNKAFVVITNPKTGEILAMAGKQIKKKGTKYKIYDYTPGITTSPVTVGSVIKGASHIVGYNTGALKIGESRYDTCVKLAGTPLKCSWMPLGLVNDITALKKSSNTYQYYTAMKVAKVKYVYNGGIKVNEQAFKTYRDIFASFGLGVKTGIDLPIESLGYKGKSEVGGLLLDFAIGQYDTYTPIQLSQYISTIANNGSRIKPHLLKKVVSSSNNKTLVDNKPEELNKVDTKQKYLNRVKEGFKEVLKYGGTGSGYINLKYKPAGKTGTSQSFVDTDGDGKIDKETITTNFVAYAPYDNPTVTFTVITPDIYYSTYSNYQSGVNRRIVKQVTDTYFKIYK